jgi:transaldolase
VCGATSNPAIFASAIANSEAYKAQLRTLEGKTPKEKYEALAIEDIKTAADILRPVYDKGEGDGYISIEVDPFLAHDTEGTLQEGKRLFSSIDKPNVMIKVPATDAGYGAMEALLAEGISVNATLVFSPEQARKCVDAMQKGMAKGPAQTHGVISVFVSRFDRALDEMLRKNGMETGMSGIYNAALAYNLIERANEPRIRTLFASTGVKGDDLPAAYYVSKLKAPHAVNTAPLHTIEAYETAKSEPSALPRDDKECEAYFERLKEVGIDIDDVREKLLEEGLVAFEEAFAAMLKKLD